MKDLCNSCRGLGCVECGLQGTVERADPAPPPVRGVPSIGAIVPNNAFAAPSMITLRQMTPAGKCLLRFDDVQIFDLSGHPIDVASLRDNDRCVFQLVVRAGRRSPNGEFVYDVQLEPI